MKISEGDLEDQFVRKLVGLKYTHRPDIHDRAKLEDSFRQKFESLNRIRLTDAEFARLLDEIITQEVSSPPRRPSAASMPSPATTARPRPGPPFAVSGRRGGRVIAIWR